MTTAGTVSVAVAGGVTFLISPFVLVKEWNISKLPTIRRRLSELMKEAKSFEREVNNLTEERTELESEIDSLQGGTETLKKIIQDQSGGNVDDFVMLVQENQRLLHEMKENLREVVVQGVVKLVLQSDLDRTGVLRKKEAEVLAKRLEITLDVYGIIFDTNKFLKVVGLSPSLPSVLKIVKRLLPCEDGNESVLHRHASLYSNERLDSELTDYSGEDDDVLDMFYLKLDRETKKGSAEAIYGVIENTKRRLRRSLI